MEKTNPIDRSTASIIRKPSFDEIAKISGKFQVKCFGKDGRLKWEDVIENLITTVGKNLTLDTLLAGSGYTVTGPYMGLISSVGWSGVNAADTMSSHSGWNEAGTGVNYPLYTGDRKTCAWDAASGGSKSLSSALSFTIVTTGGTIKGCFIVLGTGASATKGDTGGTLYSAGTFTGGDKVVDVDDVVQVSYTTSLT